MGASASLKIEAQRHEAVRKCKTVFSKEHIRELWRRLDSNGNNIVSLAEIDKLVVDLSTTGKYHGFFDGMNNKPALMRAYKQTTSLEGGGDGDDWVEKEFKRLLLNLWIYNKLWNAFEDMDTGNDRRIDMQEFKAGLENLGIHLSSSEAEDEFNKVDDGGGQILFDEFCTYCIGMLDGKQTTQAPRPEKSGTHRTTHSRNEINPANDGGGDEGMPGGDESVPVPRSERHQNHAGALTRGFSLDEAKRSCDRVFDKASIKSLWRRLDSNGNNIVSLAEIDKMVNDLCGTSQYGGFFRGLNNKPALMRAYKRTTSKEGGGDGDDWIEKFEFKKLLLNLWIYNKLWSVFDDIDTGDDRRIDAPEFEAAAKKLGIFTSKTDIEAEFRSIDTNGGGQILFDEFCEYCIEYIVHGPRNQNCAQNKDEAGDEVIPSEGGDESIPFFRRRKNVPEVSSGEMTTADLFKAGMCLKSGNNQRAHS